MIATITYPESEFADGLDPMSPIATINSNYTYCKSMVCICIFVTRFFTGCLKTLYGIKGIPCENVF